MRDLPVSHKPKASLQVVEIPFVDSTESPDQATTDGPYPIRITRKPAPTLEEMAGKVADLQQRVERIEWLADSGSPVVDLLRRIADVVAPQRGRVSEDKQPKAANEKGLVAHVQVGETTDAGYLTVRE